MTIDELKARLSEAEALAELRLAKWNEYANRALSAEGRLAASEAECFRAAQVHQEQMNEAIRMRVKAEAEVASWLEHSEARRIHDEMMCAERRQFWDQALVAEDKRAKAEAALKETIEVVSRYRVSLAEEKRKREEAERSSKAFVLAVAAIAEDLLCGADIACDHRGISGLEGAVRLKKLLPSQEKQSPKEKS